MAEPTNKFAEPIAVPLEATAPEYTVEVITELPSKPSSGPESGGGDTTPESNLDESAVVNEPEDINPDESEPTFQSGGQVETSLGDDNLEDTNPGDDNPDPEDINLEGEDESNKPNESNELDEQEGGGYDPLPDIKIDYLTPDDEELINSERVLKQVRTYIENYRSEEFKNYKKNLTALYQKYSNKRYIIENLSNVITVFKYDTPDKNPGKGKVDKKDKARKYGDIVMELKQPEYIYLNSPGYFDDMRAAISNTRTDLQYHYQKLVNKFEVKPEEKVEFEKARKKFIEYLETYYIQSIYYARINGIDNNNKMNITILENLEYRKESAEVSDILEGTIYKIDRKLIEEINMENSNKLNQYNELIAKIQATKDVKNNKKLIEEIKTYLDRSNITKLDKQIKDIAKHQHNYINYIVASKPL